MTESRSQRLQRIADIAAHRAESAASVVAERCRILGAAQHRLRELERFRSDYARLPNARISPCIRAPDLLNRRQFIANIDAAIVQQCSEVEACRQRLVQARAHWLDYRRRGQALNTVAQKWQEVESSAAERAEQDSLDERSQYYKRPLQHA